MRRRQVEQTVTRSTAGLCSVASEPNSPSEVLITPTPRRRGHDDVVQTTAQPARQADPEDVRACRIDGIDNRELVVVAKWPSR